MNSIPSGDSQLIHHAVGAQARRSPQRTAVEFGTDRLTYGELWDRAWRLAGRLHAAGVRRDSVVAVAMERSLELPVALLGVLASGGAYLPVDPGYPAARQAFMLADSGVRVLLTQQRLPDPSPGFGGTVIPIGEGSPSPTGCAAWPAGHGSPSSP